MLANPAVMVVAPLVFKELPRPNIIFIVADDLGFADLGCYGGRDAELRPRVAGARRPGRQGPQAHAGLFQLAGVLAHPLCADDRPLPVPPARRGRRADQQQEPGSTTLGLPPEHPTLPSLLRAPATAPR
jgi:hypothetical protein